MKTKRSAWDGPREESWRERSKVDSHYVDGMPSNEERLRHLDFYTRANDNAPIVSGGKKGMQGFKRYEREQEYMEEHAIDIDINHRYEIRKVGI